MRRIIAMLLAITLFFTSAGEIFAAELSNSKPDVTIETDVENVFKGSIGGKGVGIPLEESNTVIVPSADLSKLSQVYNHDWDKYSTNYYYNMLSEDEKALWDTLDKLCVYYLETNLEIEDYYDAYDNCIPNALDCIPIDFEVMCCLRMDIVNQAYIQL